MTKEHKVEDLVKQVREQQMWLSDAGYTAYNVDIAFKAIIKAIQNVHESLPPVTPTRKVGKWIKTGGSFRCSECMVMPEFKDIRTLKYCPNCGAEMRGSEND